jgi:thioesterase domain-containing protein/acyl carrier protein
MVSEAELLLAPEFFATLAADHPAVGGLDIQVKRGQADNELNQYRYDVVIRKTPTPARSLAIAPTCAWTECQGPHGLHTHLTSQRPTAVRITGIPRAGLIRDVRVEGALAAGLPLADATADPADLPESATPEQLHRLGEDTGYRVAVTWGAEPGTLDAVFLTDTADVHAAPLTDVYVPIAGARHRSAHANTPHTNTTIGALRHRLGEQLPDYMVPAHIVALDEFPLTSSGKLDRKALPEPVFTATPFEAPQTPTEEIIAGIYAQVLGVDRVGVDDSFFDLGGDSLSAMRAVAAINTTLDTQLAVRTVFYAPSVRSLGQQLGRQGSAVEVVPVEVYREGSGVPLICVHDGLGLSWSYRTLGNHLDCPIVGINQVSADGEPEPGSIRTMAASYADRIQSLYPAGPFKILGWSFGGVVAHELAIELRRRGCDVQRLVLLDPAFSIKLISARSVAIGESQILEHILRTNQMNVPNLSGPLTYERAAEVMRQRDGVEFPLPPKELLELMVRSVNANHVLLRRHRPGVFDGDTVIFAAARGTLARDGDPARGQGLRARVAARSQQRKWRPHVGGDLVSHLVECTHHDMLSTASLAGYGERLKSALDA